MRVLVLSDLLRPNGAGVMALLAARLMRDAGHSVGVIGGSMTADLEDALRERYEFAGAFTHDERALDGSVTRTDHRAFRRALHSWLHDSIHTFAPDVLYVHNCGRVLTQRELASLSQRIPVAHTMHDEWFYTDAHYTFDAPSGERVRTFEPGRSEWIIEHRYDELFDVPFEAGTFTAIGPSRWLTERAMRVFPTLDIVHLPNAVDVSLFGLQDRPESRKALGLPPDASIVLFVGNPTQARKGLPSLEAALRTLDDPPLLLVAGGSGSVAIGGADMLVRSGPLRQRLDAPDRNPVGALGLRGPAIVVSGLDRSLMPALYGAADVLVHPSRIDNLPTVPIESGLCGTRCLASDVGGTSETIADPADLFDANISPAELGERINDALIAARSESAEVRDARRSVQLKRFAPAVHTERLLPLLESLAGRGASND